MTFTYPIRFRFLALVVAAIASLAIFGCGGDDGGGEETQPEQPEASASIEDFAGQLEAAARQVQEGDCEAYYELTTGEEEQPCAAIRQAVGRGLTVTGSAAYGTGGVIDTTSQGQPGNQMWVAAVEADGGWALGGSAFTDGETVGTTPDDLDVYQRVIDGYITGLREQDCDTYYENVLTPEGTTKQEQCEAELNAPGAQTLRENPEVSPERLGGNAFVQFYGLALPDGAYYTIPIVSFAPVGENVAQPGENPLVTFVVRGSGDTEVSNGGEDATTTNGDTAE